MTVRGATATAAAATTDTGFAVSGQQSSEADGAAMQLVDLLLGRQRMRNQQLCVEPAVTVKGSCIAL